MPSTDESGISDQAMLIYSWFTFGAALQLFNVFGIITNCINIVCFAKIGFNDSIIVSLFGLSVSDLGGLIMMTFMSACVTPAMTTADLPFIPDETGYATVGLTHITFTRVSGCITAMITLERCLCITAPLKVKQIVTQQRVAGINICFFIVFFSSDVPNFVANSLGMKYVPSRNKTLLGIVGTSNRAIVTKFSFIINTFTIPFGAFIIIVVCTTIIAVELKKNAKWREKTVSSSQNDKATRRNYKVAKMVVMVSTLFIICFIPISTSTLAIAFVPEMSVLGKYLNIALIIAGFGYLMESVNSSMNIFFYYNMSSHYRRTFRNYFYLKGNVIAL